MSGVELMPKKGLPHAVHGSQVGPPDDAPGSELDGVDPPLGADRVDPAGGNVDHRTRAGAVVVPVAVAVRRWITETPVRGAGLGVQALDDLLVVDPVQVDEAIAVDGRRSVARTGGQLPDQRRRERSAQARLGRHRVVGRSEKRRPVVGARIGSERSRSAMRNGPTHRGFNARCRLRGGRGPAGRGTRSQQRRRQRAQRRAPRQHAHLRNPWQEPCCFRAAMHPAWTPASAVDRTAPGTHRPRPSGYPGRTAATGSPAADCRASRRRRSPPARRRTRAAAPRSAGRR